MIDAFVIAYNQAPYVRQAVDSVLSQTVPCNLYILDDCSDDGSQAIIETLPGTHVFHEHNLGICASLNQLLCMSSGEYIAILAADDYWLEHHLETLLFKIGDHGVCYSDGLITDPGGELITTFSHRYTPNGVPQGHIYDNMKRRNWINACACLIKRQCFDTVGLYDERLVYEDWDMWIRISREFTFRYVDEVTTVIRELPTSLSATELHKNTQRARYSNRIIAQKVQEYDNGEIQATKTARNT